MVALALAVQAAAPPPAGDIVVLGRRLREWRGTFKANADGVSRACRTRHSTGDAALDAIGCAALVDCYTELHPRAAAIMAEGQPRRQADARMAALLQAEMPPCLDRRHDAAIAALAAKRQAGTAQ